MGRGREDKCAQLQPGWPKGLRRFESPTHAIVTNIRGIAQPGRAPALGAGCRMFESCYPDQF